MQSTKRLGPTAMLAAGTLIVAFKKSKIMNSSNLEPVHVTRFYNASPEAVFDAWTHPGLVRKWLFVGPTSEIVAIDLDLRINGKFSILEFEKSNQENIDHFGSYVEIERPHKLVFTLSVPKHFPGETKLTIEIASKNEGSELKLTQTGVSREVTEKSWLTMLEQLALAIENQ